MIRFASGLASFTGFRAYRRLCLALAAVALTFLAAEKAAAYSLQGKSWPAGSNIVLQLGLGNSPVPLDDGNTNWNEAILPVLQMWTSRVSRLQMTAVMNSTAAAASGDKVNSVVFSNSVYGQSFGNGTLAVTYYMMQGSNLIEADVLFNRAMTFNSYRGALRFGGPGSFALADIRRVFLHELGHGIGLNHSEGDNVMASTVSNREDLSNDDVAGAQVLYGPPAPPPPPPSPTPTPTPPTDSQSGRLVNISTRMKVGVDENVLIGGFIIQGSEPKRLLLRATGPSLAGVIGGAMGDPTLEVFDGAGRMIAQNDDWQSGSQSGEIVASGIAPNHGSEPAIIASLSPGNYTAIVRGANRGQGIALVEGYALDNTNSRLVNLSTRGRIGLGDEVLIGGLIVQGTSAKRLIIRAVGPSLAAVLPGALADPTLVIIDAGGNQIYSNDNWATSSQRDEIVGSNMAPGHPLDSAVVATLAPGTYTAIVRGINNSTGIGLIEVFDLE